MNQICSKCREEKSSDEFYKQTKSRIGLSLYCKKCSLKSLREWRSKNPKRPAELSKNWRDKNKEKSKMVRAASYAKRRAFKVNGSINSSFIKQLMDYQKCMCVVCRKDISKSFHLDHIVPISKGGNSEKYNLQLLCPECNLRKWNKSPIDFMQSMGYLL